MPINMSYCRFENTLTALRECRDWLAERDELSDPIESLSEPEAKAARKLMKLCGELAADYGGDE